MTFDPKIHHRRSTRLKDWDYSWPWWYYVTICAHQKGCLFGEIVGDEMQLNSIGRVVKEEWLRSPEVRKEVELDMYVIMPNHLHGIVIVNDRVGATRRVAPTEKTTLVSGSLGAIVGQFKSKSARRINEIRETKGTAVWQRGFHDHIIRNEADLARIREYIWNNPLQWALDEENPMHEKG